MCRVEVEKLIYFVTTFALLVPNNRKLNSVFWRNLSKKATRTQKRKAATLVVEENVSSFKDDIQQVDSVALGDQDVLLQGFSQEDRGIMRRRLERMEITSLRQDNCCDKKPVRSNSKTNAEKVEV